MLLTGDPISAKYAKEIGLINDHFSKSKISQEVFKVAKKISSKSNLIIKIGKKAFYKQLEMPLSKAYQYTSQVMRHPLEAASQIRLHEHRMAVEHPLQGLTIHNENEALAAARGVALAPTSPSGRGKRKRKKKDRGDGPVMLDSDDSLDLSGDDFFLLEEE